MGKDTTFLSQISGKSYKFLLQIMGNMASALLQISGKRGFSVYGNHIYLHEFLM